MKKLSFMLAMLIASIATAQAKVVICEDKIESISVQSNNDVWIWFEYEDTAKIKVNHAKRYELLGRAYMALSTNEVIRFKIENGEWNSNKCHDLDGGVSTLLDILNYYKIWRVISTPNINPVSPIFFAG